MFNFFISIAGYLHYSTPYSVMGESNNLGSYFKSIFSYLALLAALSPPYLNYARLNSLSACLIKYSLNLFLYSIFLFTIMFILEKKNK